ncbi:MAG: PD-(D/E)XK nuclease family protein, partial [Alistipes sp.]|nr:PD-(D/E)XK nuclease family protein [Alistipes sp.]
MKTFLGEVAQTLYERYGEQISSCEILFPSRRARLFFTEALGRLIKTPLWQPQWRSMDELMEQVSGLRRGDRLRLLTELYKLYSTFHDEPFDRFYFWGEMLLSDFDTIDKYNIPADQLFRNIEDIKEIEADISYLTPRQLQILKFWSSLGADADLSVEKQRFLAIWRTLLPLYEQFRERLQSLGFAYGGMIQREAARRIRSGEFAFEADRHFVVAGFNALSACEKELFRCMQTTAKTDFFWDFDTYYTAREEQEAGMFVRENQHLFPAAAPISHEGMSRPKQMAAVAAASNAVQCKYVTEILRRWAAEGPLDKETAIVLTDEELLMPLLYSLPPELGKVNVTMGYPLQQTPAYTLVERLIALQARGRRQGAGWAFYHADVMGLLMHPCLQGCCPEERKQLCWEIVQERRITLDTERLSVAEPLGQIFRPAGSWQELSDWLQQCLMLAATQPIAEQEQARMREYLAVTSEAVAKLRNSLDACDIELTVEIYTSLLRRHLQTVRIPFEGEPLEGIQVMGILETRNLDFKRVIILSMTDDNFPGNLMGQSSFIPYTLRAAYDLPTPEHHEGVYAYYFYRLIQRAEEVQMLYCSHADDRSTGEPSRYIRQLDYESGFTVQQIDVGVDVNLTDTEPIEVVKDAAIMRRLERYLDPESPAALSPSSFGRYVSCPLRFYFHSVARLKSEEEVNEELDAPMFGTILHAAAQELYEQVL